MASWASWLSTKPRKSRDQQEAEDAFTPAELKELRGHFEAASGSARDAVRRGLDGAQFAALLGRPYDGLELPLQSRLLQLVADKTDGRVHLEGVTIAKAHLERLGEEASLQFTFRLLDVSNDGALSYGALQTGLLSCLRMVGALRPSAKALASPSACAATVPGTGAGVASPHASSLASPPATPDATLPAGVEAQVAAVCRGALALAAGVGAGDGPCAPADTALNWLSIRMPFDKYCQWTKRCPALHRTLCGLMRHVGAGDVGPGGVGPSAEGAQRGGQVQVRPAVHNSAGAEGDNGSGRNGDGGDSGAGGASLPVLSQLGKLPPDATLLRPIWTWALSSRLPVAQRSEWRLLFNSQRDGKSFNTFIGRVTAAPGPTLLLIRDKAGVLFGGYASQPWAKSGSYYGDVSSFLFSLLPTFQVFPATGINDNYQWCGVGFSQLPGGLGFGGAATSRGHFALYVEPSLDAGMSRPIATYGNCPLASEQVFQVATLECWLLQRPPDEEDSPQPSAGSGHRGPAGGVLNRGEERAFMELAGMKMHSDGLRDEPLEEG